VVGSPYYLQRIVSTGLRNPGTQVDNLGCRYMSEILLKRC